MSKYLGHAGTKETLDTYAHMFPNNLEDVKNTIDNLNLVSENWFLVSRKIKNLKIPCK